GGRHELRCGPVARGRAAGVAEEPAPSGAAPHDPRNEGRAASARGLARTGGSVRRSGSQCDGECLHPDRPPGDQHGQDAARPCRQLQDRAASSRGGAGVRGSAQDDLSNRALPDAGVHAGGNGPVVVEDPGRAQSSRPLRRGRQTMKRHVTRTVIVATAMFVMAAVSPAVAQETTAEVRTWGGQSVVLSGPWIEVFYTVMPRSWGGAETPPPTGGVPAPPMGTTGGTQ